MNLAKPDAMFVLEDGFQPLTARSCVSRVAGVVLGARLTTRPHQRQPIVSTVSHVNKAQLRPTLAGISRAQPVGQAHELQTLAR